MKSDKVKPKKYFGQNFLKDKSIIERIVKSIPNNLENDIKNQDLELIEIGPGLGDLTKSLLRNYPRLKVFEVDSDLCSLIIENFKNDIKNGSLILQNQDVMEIINIGICDKDYFLYSNLPYYIATHIVLALFRDPRCKGFTVMTQLEVAEKFCSDVGNSDFSPLAIIAQTEGKTEFCFEVEASSFNPPPKVTSAVFSWQRNKTKEAKSTDRNYLKDFEKFLKASFAMPRKTLISNLKNIENKAKLLEIFKSLNIEESIRPHQTNTNMYHQIFKLLKGIKNGK